MLARGGAVGLEQLSAALTAPAGDAAVKPPEARRIDRRERLVAALRAHHGNVSATARALGKARSQVQRWIRDYRLDPMQYHDQ